MARAKYKFGQLIKSGTLLGTIQEIRTTETGVTYVLEDDEKVDETSVEAVYRAVTPRAKKTTGTVRARSKKTSENRANA